MQNTSHAVMSQRIESKSSADDFPTPPWHACTKEGIGAAGTTTRQSSQGSTGAETSGLRALADLVANLKGPFCPHRRYVLERVDGELVFRQPEIDAIVEDAINEVYDILPPAGRRIIKLP